MKLHSRWSMTDIIIIVAAEIGGRAKANKYSMQITLNELYVHLHCAKNDWVFETTPLHFNRSPALIPIKANPTRAQQSWTLEHLSLSIALSKSPGSAPLADLWAFPLPLRSVSIIKAQRGEMRPGSKFPFVRGHRLCRYEGRGGHLKSTPLIHHTHMQCTYHMSNGESTKETTPPRPSMWDGKTYKSDSFMSTLINRRRVKAELLLWAATKGIQVSTWLS